MSRIMLPKLLERAKNGKRGAVVNLSSVAVVTRMHSFGTYAATKSFNHTLSHTMWKEVGDELDVLTVCPGPTLT